MHFKWQCWNTYFVVVCRLIIAVHSSNDLSWWLPTPECQKMVKGHVAMVMCPRKFLDVQWHANSWKCLKLQTSNLAHMHPGTVPTWLLKKISQELWPVTEKIGGEGCTGTSCSLSNFVGEATAPSAPPLPVPMPVCLLYFVVNEDDVYALHTSYIHYTYHTLGCIMASTLPSMFVSNTCAFVSFLSQWAASHIRASGPFLLSTKWA